MSLQFPDLHKLNGEKGFSKIFSRDGVIRLRFSISAKIISPGSDNYIPHHFTSKHAGIRVRAKQPSRALALTICRQRS
jgi:hypothetical protein